MDKELKMLCKLRAEMGGKDQLDSQPRLSPIEWLPLALEMFEDGCTLREIADELGLVGQHEISIAVHGSVVLDKKPVATPDQTARYLAALAERTHKGRPRGVTTFPAMSVAERKAWILAQPSRPTFFPDGKSTQNYIYNYRNEDSSSYDPLFAAVIKARQWNGAPGRIVGDYHERRERAVIQRFLALEQPPVSYKENENDYNQWRMVLRGKLPYLEVVLREHKPDWFLPRPKSFANAERSRKALQRLLARDHPPRGRNKTEAADYRLVWSAKNGKAPHILAALRKHKPDWFT